MWRFTFDNYENLKSLKIWNLSILPSITQLEIQFMAKINANFGGKSSQNLKIFAKMNVTEKFQNYLTHNSHRKGSHKYSTTSGRSNTKSFYKSEKSELTQEQKDLIKKFVGKFKKPVSFTENHPLSASKSIGTLHFQLFEEAWIQWSYSRFRTEYYDVMEQRIQWYSMGWKEKK